LLGSGTASEDQVLLQWYLGQDIEKLSRISQFLGRGNFNSAIGVLFWGVFTFTADLAECSTFLEDIGAIITHAK
jgi:hypothetical protein